MRFGRTYRMSVQGQHFTWTPAYPLTLQFDVQRSTFSSANKATFTLYNLREAARSDIFLNRTRAPSQRLRIVLQAGYTSSPVLPAIFMGDLRTAWTERRGIDWITQIEAFDGGFAFYNAQAGFSLDSGYTMQSAAAALVAKMAPFGVTLGNVSKIKLPNSRGIAFSDTAWVELQKLVPGDGQLFVDNGICYILNPQDYLPTPTVPIISPATGLIGTPMLDGTIITVKLIFDPRYIVGQLVALSQKFFTREIAFEVKGMKISAPQLKVVGIHHYGKISAVEGGELITELRLMLGFPGQPLTAVGTVSENIVA